MSTNFGGWLVQWEVGCNLVLALDPSLLFCIGPIGLSRSSIAPCQWTQVCWVTASVQTALVSLMSNAVFGQEAASPSRVGRVTTGAVPPQE